LYGRNKAAVCANPPPSATGFSFCYGWLDTVTVEPKKGDHSRGAAAPAGLGGAALTAQPASGREPALFYAGFVWPGRLSASCGIVRAAHKPAARRSSNKWDMIGPLSAS
jgi:hypothetical protein